jgi:putative ABC transport system permease protein
MLLSLFINELLSWDKYNEKYDRIYRLQLFMDQQENVIRHSSSVTAALSRHNLPEVPEIEKIALIHDVGDNNRNGVFLSLDKKNQFLTKFGYFADQSVFDIFTFNFVEGDRQLALTQPYSIVLSKKVAEKLFPAEKALGKQVYGENKVTFTVTGVYDDLPEKSSWRPMYLLPMISFTAMMNWKDFEDDYWGYTFYTYVLLKQNADPASVDGKIYGALKEYRKEHHPYLRPMSKLYLNPYFENDMYIALTLFSFIALLILVLSSINFINLQTANATTRLREIGIKKTVGFSKKQLWSQLIIESLFISLIAGVLGLFTAQLALPFFNRLIGTEILTSLVTNWKLLTFVFSVTLLTGFLSGIFPALAIASFNPVMALKQKFIQEENNRISLKKLLMTGQFSISIFLLVVSFIIFRQSQYLLNKDMGFESENLVFSNIVTKNTGDFEPIRQRLMKHPEIADACISDYIPFILPGGDDITWEGGRPDEKVFVRVSNVSYDFVTTFNLAMHSGRNFSREFPSDTGKCLINETTARVFGWKEPLGRQIKIWGKNLEVIGVIKDYIACSVHSPLEPHMYRLSGNTCRNGVYSVRYFPGYEKKARGIIQEEFERSFPDDAFEFKNIRSLIQNEDAVKFFRSFRKICGFFALLSIFISSIGLFGLVLFFTRRKMKEIGIRKVLGFSFGNLYMTLSTGFIRLLFISVVVAWPAAYYVYKVLPGANKYGIQIWEFLLATLFILLVAIITISYQIITAVRKNPVDVLKDE